MNSSSELEKVLRKKLGENVILLRSQLEPLLPLGENFAGKIQKLTVVVKKGDQEQELNLVAKMMPDSEFLKNMFDSCTAMEKEIFLYEELVPAYQKLESEFGVDELFDIVPEFYGAQFSNQSDRKMNNDAAMFMQNLNFQGFYMEDRRKGLDLEHTKVVVAALARFHALGIAMKQHNPDYFEILKKRSKCINLQFDDTTKEFQEFFLEVIRKNMTGPNELYVHVEEAIKRDYRKNFFAEASEPWATIIHSDFWINNFMFRKDGGKVVEVKFIDFQNYLYETPQRDRAFFLATNLNDYMMENKFDDMIDFYYDKFMNVLKIMKCDLKPFGRSGFDEGLKIDAYKEFFHCVFMTKNMTMCIKSDDNTSNAEKLMLKNTVYPELERKLRILLNKFVEKDWLFVKK